MLATAQLTGKNGPITSVGTTVLGSELDARLKFLEDVEVKIARQAAKTATDATRNGFKYRRDVIAQRPGRSSTGGQMGSFLHWKAFADGSVAFDVLNADREAPHWFIQEIGTGKRARMRVGGQAEPRGRPRNIPRDSRAVKSQRGRRLSRGLVFASGGQYSPPGSAQGEQIQIASRVTGVPLRAASIRIGKEITGQHMVQRGGRTGFRQYETNLLSAARRAFTR